MEEDGFTSCTCVGRRTGLSDADAFDTVASWILGDREYKGIGGESRAVRNDIACDRIARLVKHPFVRFALWLAGRM